MKKTLLLLAFLFLAVPVMAQNVVFEWDPHPEAAQLQGFKLYQSKQSGQYSAPPVATFNGGNLTTGSIAQPALGRWYFVLTAFTPEGLESGFSNEVTTVVKPKPPVLKTAVQTALLAPVKGAKKLYDLALGNENTGLRIK